MFSQCEAEKQGGFAGSQAGAGGQRKGARGAAGYPGLAEGRCISSDRDGAEQQHTGATGETLKLLSGRVTSHMHKVFWGFNKKWKFLLKLALHLNTLSVKTPLAIIFSQGHTKCHSFSDRVVFVNGHAIH